MPAGGFLLFFGTFPRPIIFNAPYGLKNGFGAWGLILILSVYF